MANTSWATAGALSRPHWAGADADTDQHLEIYEGEVQTRFHYQNIFSQFSSQRSLQDRSNTYRIDRLGQSAVKGRKSGEAVVPTKQTNEKLVITLDTMLYIRNPIDYIDDWTAPDFLREMGQNNGSAFAETFDEAHIIQLINGKEYQSPAHLKPAIGDGMSVTVTIKQDAVSQADLEANAILLNLAHKAAVQKLIDAKVPMSDIVTIVDTEVYGALTEHPKLLNMDYDTVNGGDYSGRRVVRLNSVPVVEVTEFPTQAYTTQAPHPIGAAFSLTADDAAKCKMILFSKSKTLVTIEAQPFVSRFWDDQKEMTNVLDCYAMYTVANRRPDTAVVVEINKADKPVGTGNGSAGGTIAGLPSGVKPGNIIG